MMNTSLFTTIKSEFAENDNSEIFATFGVKIDSSNPVFSGHFPGKPVLPGACTLSVIRDCMAIMTNSKILLKKISQCKFTGMVDPQTDDIFEITISLKNTNPYSYTVSASVKVMNSGRSVLKLRGEIQILKEDTILKKKIIKKQK